MRHACVALLLFCLSLGMATADQVDIFVQQKPFHGPAARDGGVWWFEINQLAGALGLNRNIISGHPAPPSSFSFTYKGRTFTVPARQQGQAYLVDAQAFVRQLGGTFAFNPGTHRIDIVVPGLAAAPAANTPPPPPAAGAPITVDGFAIMAGPQASSGTPYQVRLGLTNNTAQTQQIMVHILSGENVVNEQGPAALPTGAHHVEWNFYSSLGSGQFTVQVLIDNKVVATHPADQQGTVPASGGQPTSTPTPEPTSTNPPGF